MLKACGGAAGWFLLATTLSGQTAGTAAVRVDAGRVENRISPTLYGHFAEFMFEGVKFGLHAELLRDRGFEEPANTVGLPRHWERSPTSATTATSTSAGTTRCPIRRAGSRTLSARSTRWASTCGATPLGPAA
jgi:hypothetical protein